MQTAELREGNPGREGVGVPIAESMLSNTFLGRAHRLYPPGPGRSTYVIPEAPLGHGRPDFVVITASPNRLLAEASTGLRLPSFTAARALDLSIPVGSHTVTPRHVNQLRDELHTQGWTDRRLRRFASVVFDSTMVEVKVKDWRRGIAQASRYGRFAQSTDLAIAAGGLPEPARQIVQRRGIGVVLVHAGGLSRWSHGERREPEVAARAWLTELLLRSIERDEAYAPSADLKRIKACLIASTRP